MAAESSGLAADRPHLLVVDDDRETRDLLSMYFRDQGFDVDTVKDGPDMDAWLDSHTTSLVILDLMLPGIDGMDICRRYRNEAGGDTPILMLTARDTLEDKVAGLDAATTDEIARQFRVSKIGATDDVRDRIMPVNRKWPVDTLFDALPRAGKKVAIATVANA